MQTLRHVKVCTSQCPIPTQAQPTQPRTKGQSTTANVGFRVEGLGGIGRIPSSLLASSYSQSHFYSSGHAETASVHSLLAVAPKHPEILLGSSSAKQLKRRRRTQDDAQQLEGVEP